MKEATKIQVFRLACGTALLITSMVTGENGNIQMMSMLLLGVPFEAIEYVKEKKET